jgi:hypothetical protein
MPDDQEKAPKARQGRKKGQDKATREKGGKAPAGERLKPVSLYPLSFEEAVQGLLQVKMTPEELKDKKKR